MAKTVGKQATRAQVPVKPDALDAETRAAIRKVRRDEAKVDVWRQAHRTWIADGRSGAAPKEPWADTNWQALSCCPKARDLTLLYASMAVDDSADLRSLIRAAADAASALERRAGGGKPGPYTYLQEVLLALSDCIRRSEAADESGGTERTRPFPRYQGIEMEMLRPLHTPALIALRAPATKELEADARATGVRVRTKSGFGRELVRLLRANVEKGLRGEALANAMCASSIWRRGPFHLERVGWPEPEPMRGRPGDLNAKLVAWTVKSSKQGLFDDAPDFEALAQAALVALGKFTKKAARNTIVAAEENRQLRRGKRSAG